MSVPRRLLPPLTSSSAAPDIWPSVAKSLGNEEFAVVNFSTETAVVLYHDLLHPAGVWRACLTHGECLGTASTTTSHWEAPPPLAPGRPSSLRRWHHTLLRWP